MSGAIVNWHCAGGKTGIMSDRDNAEILVAGTGPAGLATALLAHQAGFAVVLIGPAVNMTDARTTTLMLPSLEALERVGIDTEFGGHAAALSTMRIVDGTKRLIRAPVATFRASEIGETHFGMNIPNSVLNQSLSLAVRTAGIRWLETLVDDWVLYDTHVTAVTKDGNSVEGKLVAAADGRNSPARNAAGITLTNRPYRQSAFVTTLNHERDRAGISTEFHTETGPFTIVPLPGKRSSLVWVVAPNQVDHLLALSRGELSIRIEQRMDSMLGKISIDGDPQVFPLSSSLPSAFAANRVALVGEAAHVFPPIGAQGLNLGLRDACDLVKVAEAHRADPGTASAMATYERARRPDILARTGAVSLLNQSLLSDFLPTQFVRSTGLAILSGFAPLRGLFMREGMRPGSGFSAAASAMREQIRR